jgi:hypothetical protein
LFGPNGAPIQAFTGGGITAPWGIAVDGSDTVWVANFGGAKVSERRIGQLTQPRVSRFCGTSPEKCPIGHQTVGQPISPDEGYTSDSLIRNTGIAIDPSGNVWLTNNWKLVPPRTNPGGNAIVVMIGGATPVKPPLIGLPVSFDDGRSTQTSLSGRIRVLRPSESLPPEPVQRSSTTSLLGGTGTVESDEVAPDLLTPKDIEPDTVEASEFRPLQIAPVTVVPEVVE